MSEAKRKMGEAVTRREFIKTSAAAGLSLSAISGSLPGAFAAGSDKLRIGVIGCGGRGLHDAANFLQAAPEVELVAMGDLFPDRLAQMRQSLTAKMADKVKVTDDACFTGFDAYQKVLACELDLVILTTPPFFRPQHLRAAIEAGKHVFAEKPVAVDPVGVRSVIESAELADRKNLTIVAGVQARRMTQRIEVIKRLHDGAIGEIVGGQCIRTGDAMRGWGTIKQRPPGMSDMEWQLKRWLFLTWLSGDFIDEMHVHELDIVNWMMNAHPVKCYGMGGRAARTEPEFGNCFDHFSVFYEYPNGATIAYQGSQIDGCSPMTFERIVGTKGAAYTSWGRSYLEGENAYEYDGQAPNPEVQQHAEQIAAIRNNERMNEGVRIAESSLTAIMGRMSAFTGQQISWNWALNSSQLDLSPPECKFGPLPMRPVAVPGQTPLI